MSTVSIILPTYNGNAWIRRAIDSVIAQTYTDWELIVVDDGSVQEVQSLLPADSRICYIRNNTNLGIQKSLNKGLAIAKGIYIARVDDDDVWSDTTKLAKQVEFLGSHPEHVLIGTGVVVVDEKGNELQRYLLPISDEYIRSKILRKNCFVHSSVMFRNTGIRYSEDTHMLHAEDYELWLRLGQVGKFTNLSLYGVRFTVRKSSITGRNRVVQARRILALAWKYRSYYPCALIGVITACARYIGFVVLMIIPVPQVLFHWIQARQKSM